MTLADGCFDPLHVGHLRYLRRVLAYGRPVVVRVAPDSDIRAKGREPFQSQQERAELILALDVVDRVILDATLAEAVQRVKPRVLAKGIEWKHQLPMEVLRACQLTSTRIVYVNAPHRTSSQRLSGCW